MFTQHSWRLYRLKAARRSVRSLEGIDATEDRMDHIDAGGHRIAYERKGEGPPVVFVHGYVGDRRTWRPQIDDLSDEFTALAWDAPGFGGSSDPPETFDLADFADCLSAFIDALGLGRPHVVGLSFGGGLALELYRRHPTVPMSLVLVSAYAGWAGSLPAETVELRLQQALRLADLPPEQLVDELVPTMLADSAPTDLVDDFAASMSGTHPAGLRASARAFAEADVRGVLPTIAVPTLLLYGDKDVRAPLNVARDLHAKIPASTLVVLEGAGHICNLDAAARFNTEVRAFLRSAQS
jgi:pimeloyl-ACP methyl ester carboxylesterase